MQRAQEAGATRSQGSLLVFVISMHSLGALGPARTTPGSSKVRTTYYQQGFRVHCLLIASNGLLFTVLSLLRPAAGAARAAQIASRTCTARSMLARVRTTAATAVVAGNASRSCQCLSGSHARAGMYLSRCVSGNACEARTSSCSCICLTLRTLGRKRTTVWLGGGQAPAETLTLTCNT